MDSILTPNLFYNKHLISKESKLMGSDINSFFSETWPVYLLSISILILLISKMYWNTDTSVFFYDQYRYFFIFKDLKMERNLRLFCLFEIHFLTAAFWGCLSFITHSTVEPDANIHHYDIWYFWYFLPPAFFSLSLRIRDHSSITSAKKLVGGVRKWQFLLIYSTIYAT